MTTADLVKNMPDKQQQQQQQQSERLSAAMETMSLTSSKSERSESVASTDSGRGSSNDQQVIKCSAIHTLERDMPDFDYSHLVREMRHKILEHARQNPGLYAQTDLEKCAQDDWFLSRFLLRQKLDFKAAFEMLKAAMRFNHESLAYHLRAEDFPAELYQLGNMFPFGVDRKGNRMLYLRVSSHKKTPEIAIIVQAFIHFNIKKLDEEARGLGISLLIDCTGASLVNADMDTVMFIITTLKNYFPKGLSYFLVHELPWILKPFWHLVKNWVPDDQRRLIKFSDSTDILEYIDRDNLPDFLGGTGAKEEYCKVPENCTTLEQAAKLWGVDRQVVSSVFEKYRQDLPPETIKRIEAYLESTNKNSEAAA